MSERYISHQKITPELSNWILEQTRAGFKPQDVLQSMLTAGWERPVAVAALERTLKIRIDPQPAAVTTATASPALVSAIAMPEPDLTNSPLYLDGGDRQVAVLTVLANPRVVVLGNLLSDEECDGLIAFAKPRMARSLTVDNKTGGEEMNAARTSNGMFFQRGENELVARIEKRIARLVNWAEDRGEGIQVLQYGPGAEYKPHFDYFDPAEPGTPSILKRGGQRLGTVIMYLSEPEQGGGTVFPDLHLEVGPKRGNGVFFSYDRPHASTKTLHGGAPVVTGEKWIATKWLREGVFV
ncbi:MAG: 2OG-Fe(II) oxygenase [Burkholderiaceae bacterium]|nr:2OG-Fe(II) oxygenase [Burkholderiaceae bacterium]MDO9090864.1 2OG-Fe(II) oxygenase [Burkholderiaceae bacterium]